MASRIDQADPFFAALRARRPDVDLVLLPPERGPAGPDVVRRRVRTGEAAIRDAGNGFGAGLRADR
jgi:hypothetical protein